MKRFQEGAHGFKEQQENQKNQAIGEGSQGGQTATGY